MQQQNSDELLFIGASHLYVRFRVKVGTKIVWHVCCSVRTIRQGDKHKHNRFCVHNNSACAENTSFLTMLEVTKLKNETLSTYLPKFHIAARPNTTVHITFHTFILWSENVQAYNKCECFIEHTP